MQQATAIAHPNIALIKYWGKRDIRLNLPAVGSLSITLDALSTRTRVCFDSTLGSDSFILDGVGADARRITACLDLLREAARIDTRARVESSNDFPTAAGLASSASGFAALVVAADAALGLGLPADMLSMHARLGSGSAARSIFGGFVEMARGSRQDGTDAVARPLLAADAWPLEVVIAITERDAKALASSAAMTATSESAPFYAAWVRSSRPDLHAARQAVLARDFDALADVSVHSCLKMHAVMMSARPPVMYWNAATLACVRCLTALREAGLPVFYTIDAGPQVKAICQPEARDAVEHALRSIPGVAELRRSGLGGAAHVVEGVA
jgi:diphosphomevalonate decarboxylase